MNRTFALFLALAILLAHALALHTDELGRIAPPYDAAHVAYRMGRNLVQTGHCAWDVGLPAQESYPSIAWIAVAAVAERLYLPPTTFCQYAGALFALATVLVLARFSPVRMAGVIAPLLFVVSGGIAAAAMSGTEVALLTLLMTAAFLAYERRARLPLALLLAMACVTRPEGIVFSGTLFLLELARLRRRGEAQPRILGAFVGPLAAIVLLTLLRLTWTGQLLSPFGADLLEGSANRWHEGLLYLQDFFRAAGAPLLFAIPLVLLLGGRLGGLGTRAALLTLAWSALVAATGGGTQPYFQRMVPILAILFVAVQEAMRITLDSQRRGLPQVTWALFLMGLFASALASKHPGDLGPLRVEGLHRAWMQPSTHAGFGSEHLLGREGLNEEIKRTQRLRAIGVFLRDQLDPSHRVVTPWPGAIGYLSRLRVIDPIGRTSPPPGKAHPASWSSLERQDLVTQLAELPEYLLPSLDFGEGAPPIEQIAREWWHHLDLLPSRPERALSIYETLKRYELITVPLRWREREHEAHGQRFHLMRRKDLQLSPVLEIALEERRLRVLVRHLSHEQVVDLRVQVRDTRGELWSLRPTGTLERRPDLVARSSILLFPTGSRQVELLSVELPEGFAGSTVQAVLRNPGALGETDFDTASRTVETALP